MLNSDEAITRVRLTALEALGHLLALKADFAWPRELLIAQLTAAKTHAERSAAAAALSRIVHPQSVAAILEATGGQGCDVVVDAAGYTLTRQQGLKVTARAGVLAFVGLSDPATEIDVLDVINREIEIHGVYGYNPPDFERALGLIAAGRVDVASWVREFPLEEGPRVFEQLTSQPGDLVKASLTP